jgi:hypothetical protein
VAIGVRVRAVGLAMAAVFLATTAVAHAITIQANNPTVTLDENGVGTLQFPQGPIIPAPGVLAPDPGPGGLQLALTYNLLGPPALTAGDVILFEDQVMSDILRFNPAGAGGQNAYPASVVFYSDRFDGADALADTGFPTLFYTNILNFPEVGPEGGPNGITYTPAEGQPGFVPGFSVTYVVQSDAAIPEPSTLLLVASGLAAAKRARSRRKR